MAKSIYVADTKVNKLFIQDTPIKKVYVADTLVWQSVEILDQLIFNETRFWGNNYFGTRVAVWIKEKNYAENTMTLQVQVNIMSQRGGSIVSSRTRVGNVITDGQKREFNFVPTINRDSDRQLVLYSDIKINNASNKAIAIQTNLPIEINLSGIGYVGTATSNFNLTLPSL